MRKTQETNLHKSKQSAGGSITRQGGRTDEQNADKSDEVGGSQVN